MGSRKGLDVTYRIARAIALDALAIGLRLPGGVLVGIVLAPALAVGAVLVAGMRRGVADG